MSAYAQATNVIELVNFVLDLTLCSFLLFCLIFRTRQNLGTYRYLQITMVSIDAFYTTAQMFIRERIITAEAVFAMIPTSSFGEVLCAYLSLYNLTWIMIDYSFLYRLWAVKSPLRVGLFSEPLFIALLVSVAFIESLVWFASTYFLYFPTPSGKARMREDTLAEFAVDTEKAVMIMGDYYLADGSFNRRACSGVLLSCVIMAICFGFIIYAITDIIRHLKVSNIISKKTIRLQRQLFVTLCLQTIIPLIFLYCPCGVMILLPLTRVDSQWMARATPLLISFFLPLDSLAVLLSMTEYRREVIRVLKCGCLSTLHHTVTISSRERHSSTVHRSIIP